MPIPTSGPIKFSDIKKEFGGDSDPSLSEYSGDDIVGYPLPADGEEISLSDFRGLDFDIVEIITTDQTWYPSVGKASRIHVFVVGPGGSGGVARSGDDGFFFVRYDGTAASNGGTAGGVSYQIYDVADVGRIEFSIPEGGAAVTVSGENIGKAGNDGSGFTSANVYNKSGTLFDTLRGYNGYGGGYAWSTYPGSDTSIAGTRLGGISTGGADGNFYGGTVGRVRISKGGKGAAANGGSCPAFSTQQATLNSVPEIDTSVSNTLNPGAKVSGFLNYPRILTTYLTNLGLNPVLGSSITDFDGGDAGSEQGGDAVYGAGGGAACGINSGTSTSGKGGDGVAIIVYEIN